nr:putative reverse transcriptase domain-containing protein [Tanacetum cinerariifolium]
MFSQAPFESVTDWYQSQVIENQIIILGSPPSRVFLFGDIPTVIPSTSVIPPETSAISLVISSATPMVETTLDPYAIIVARWRSRIDTTENEDGRELYIIDRDDARDHVKIDLRDVKDDTEEYEADISAGDTFEILAKVGTVAYRLELPEKLSRVHSTFHVSNLKTCLSDEPLAIPLDEIHINDKLNFIEEPIEIMECKVKRL